MIRLKEIREEKNLSQLEIAKGIQTSQRNIGRWENGDNEPTSSFIIKLANYLNCSTDYLLGIEDEYGIIQSNSNLTVNEEQIITLYRKLNEHDQNKVLGFIQALAY